jgi:predicted XRE-type DNA-binding protein
MEGEQVHLQYDESGLTIYPKSYIEAQKGKYDDDGFYILEEGGFFDDHGYHFDKSGFNEVGGFYDPDTGDYVSPGDFDTDHDKIADYYDELCGAEGEDSADEDNNDDVVEEYNIPEDEINKGMRREHCMPVLHWLNEQPADMMHVVKILNIPRQATEDMLKKMLTKKIKDFKYDKLKLETDKGKKGNLGTAWLSTND